MSENICHKAKVIKIENNLIHTIVESTSACGSCAAKGMCNLSERTDKEVIVKTTDAENFKVGEEVILEIQPKMGLKAALIAYALPLIVILSIVVVLSLFIKNEIVIGLSALFGAVIYFFLLFKMAKYLNRQFVFGIRKT